MILGLKVGSTRMVFSVDSLKATWVVSPDDEVEVAVNGITSMIEPVIIVFLGVVVGGLVVALYLPIFTMSSTIGG